MQSLLCHVSLFFFVEAMILKLSSQINSRRLLSSLASSIKVLGIESTCDDTCASVVTSDRQVLSDVRHSQMKVHLDFGGILALVARNKHVQNINNVTRQSLEQAGLSIDDIDAVAVASRPGLDLSLHVGVSYAQKLCLKYKKPLISIHHMEAHALTALLTNPNVKYPFLTLLISGGHTILALVTAVDKFYVLADAPCNPLGETLDKIARKLKIRNLGSPYDQVCGGRALELIARHGNPNAFISPDWIHSTKKAITCSNFKIMIEGIVYKCQKKHPDLPADSPLPEVADIAASFQRAAVEHLGHKVQTACKFLESTKILEFSDIEHTIEENPKRFSVFELDYNDPRPLNLPLLVSGGVACNEYIVKKLGEYCDKMEKLYDGTKIEVIVPSPRNLCTDNGVMISWNGVLRMIENKKNSLLHGEEQIMSVKPIYDATLGVDISELVNIQDIPLKPVRIS
ncbi:threonyl-carbamoyl synthesis 4 [Brevipalpus obovatus]|uniref:threonyl-carbamoyl synthesis 4 n=1 Tax=Brevipalpus obovatus TaxID=246614 RepID=UPI003D9FA5D1